MEGFEEEYAICPKVIAEMERYIDQNYRAENVEVYPAEWLGDEERAYFCRLAESMLGESQSDRWIQNKVFRNYGNFDFDKPITDQTVEEPVKVENNPLVTQFFHSYKDFIINYVKELSSNLRFTNDISKINDGMLNGISYALSAPKENNKDQRLNFFVFFPQNLLPEIVNKYINTTNAASLNKRIQNSLTKYKFITKKPEEISPQESAFRSIFLVRDKNRGLRAEFLKALSEIAQDTSNTVCDGVLSYFAAIVKVGDNKDLEKFIGYHINFQTRSERENEKRRKEHEISIYHEDEGGDMVVDDRISLTEDINESGVTRNSAAVRHVEQRNQTYEERRQKAEKVKEFTSESLQATSQLVELIRKQTKTEAIEAYKTKVKEGSESNESDVLGLLLPEALRYYMQAAIDCATALIHPSNEADVKLAHKKGLRLVYKQGRSVIGFASGGKRDLGSLVDLDGLELPLLTYRNNKKKIYSLYQDKKSANEIASLLQFEEEFVNDTLMQIPLIELYIQKLRASKKQSKEKYKTVDDFFDHLTATNIKNAFAWRWGRILTILYAPAKNGNDKIYTPFKYANGNFKLHPSKFPKRIRRKLKKEFESISDDALSDLASMLTIHSFISEGTIPDRAYPTRIQNLLNVINDDKDLDPAEKTQAKWNLLNQPLYRLVRPEEMSELNPGIAWGHNICRQTGESNVKMFYDIFHNGLDRKNPKHRIIRHRAATILRMRRLKKIWKTIQKNWKSTRICSLE